MGSRSNSIPRKSGEQMIAGITEEDEEEEMEEDELDEEEMEEVDQFGPDLGRASAVPIITREANATLVLDGESTGDGGGMSTAPVSPLGPLTPQQEKVEDPLDAGNGAVGGGEGEGKGKGIPLTAEALIENQRVVEEKEKEEVGT